MREIRSSGSVGGAPQSNAASLPLSRASPGERARAIWTGTLYAEKCDLAARAIWTGTLCTPRAGPRPHADPAIDPTASALLRGPAADNLSRPGLHIWTGGFTF